MFGLFLDSCIILIVRVFITTHVSLTTHFMLSNGGLFPRVHIAPC